MKEKIKIQDIVDETIKGVLSLCIAELNDALKTSKLSNEDKVAECNRIINGWVNGFKLYPEKVKTIPKELGDKYAMGEIGFDKILEYLRQGD